jgi:hypothetical protein
MLTYEHFKIVDGLEFYYFSCGDATLPYEAPLRGDSVSW